VRGVCRPSGVSLRVELSSGLETVSAEVSTVSLFESLNRRLT
jgi:hypothetical protein